MKRTETALIWWLRLSACMLLTAVVPAAMPFAWMDTIHRWLDLGELPDRPIVGYLTRSASLLYALHGALLLFVAGDIRRYLPFIKFLAQLSIAFGVGMFALDAAVGMPWPWRLGEGLSIVSLGGVMLWLAQHNTASGPDRW